jgi:hypothetical protein
MANGQTVISQDYFPGVGYGNEPSRTVVNNKYSFSLSLMYVKADNSREIRVIENDIWKDNRDGYFNDMSVANGDVYLCGSLTEQHGYRYQIVYWKNGQKTVLAEDANMSCFAREIRVLGNDIFVLGYLNSNGVIWKNGEVIFTTSDYREGFYHIAILPHDSSRTW